MSSSQSPVRRLLSGLLDLVAPRTCVACRAPCTTALCPTCERRVEEPPARRLRDLPVVAAATYLPPVSDAVRSLKYARRPDLAAPLSELLIARLRAAGLSRHQVLVPVPLHRVRLAERGYNQSALLAHELGRLSGAAYAPLALERVRNTPQLAGRSRAVRTAAMADAFAARRPVCWQHRPVVLVDDVVTTGATAGACVDALRRAGVVVELVVAVAVAPSRH